ncbi:MAG: ParB/RepB/Spo0J family partition protein [Bacteroidales bacterium]|jgi:ParB family chromosome partitioning protein|nr:ParB/RepB/Spo0J family partition protein [Bacteroidales bacterium]
MDRKNNPKLGRGLGALLSGSEIPIAPNSAARVNADKNSLIDIEHIEANPYQPRTVFEEKALEELAQSIKNYGIITPITVRPLENGHYQLISGERRLRAGKIAGLKEIPAYVRTANDETSTQMALVENIQREDLNALEIALSFRRLIDEFNFTQDQLGEKIGKNRSTVSNYIRLLNLCNAAQVAVRDNLISMGHARAIVVIDDETLQNKIVQQIIKEGLSVRQTEELIKKQDENKPKSEPVKMKLSEEAKLFKKQLAKKLNAKVNIATDPTGKGKITIAFDSDEVLGKIMATLS